MQVTASATPTISPIQPPGPIPQERAALNRVLLRRFVLAPPKVKPFRPVTVSWDVVVPDDSPFDIDILLNGERVAPTGSTSVTVVQPRTFRLTAQIADDPRVNRQLHVVNVVVDTSECRTEQLPISVVTVPVKQAIDQAFASSGHIELGQGGASVSAGNPTLDIALPLNIRVPDWFDGDMQVRAQLIIGGSNGQVVVFAQNVDVDVDWSLLSDLLSLGATALIGRALTQMGQAFMRHIIDAEVVPAVRQGLSDEVARFTGRLRDADPQHRNHVMTTLSFTSVGGLTIVACPTT